MAMPEFKDIVDLVKKGATVEAQEKIMELRSGKAKKEDLIMMSQLTRKPSDYAATGPHVMAVKKAMEKGKKFRSGTLVEFIIAKKGKSISDKAVLAEDFEEGDYDADYYIENQLLPAVIRIIRELGYSEEDLKQGGKQSSLGKWG